MVSDQSADERSLTSILSRACSSTRIAVLRAGATVPYIVIRTHYLYQQPGLLRVDDAKFFLSDVAIRLKGVPCQALLVFPD